MDNPKKLWKDYMHDAGSFDKAAKQAFDLYFTKYSHKSDLKNTKEPFTDKWFIPGKIYAFLYSTKTVPSSDRPFINRRPVVLSMGQMESNGKTFEVGIDLMLVPFLVRVELLSQLHKYFGPTIDQNEKDIDSGRKGKNSIGLNYENAKKVFFKLGWQMAFQAYDKTKLGAVSIYDYKDWVSIIPLFTRGVEGTGISSVYDKYIKRITNPTDPVNDMTEKKKNGRI